MKAIDLIQTISNLAKEANWEIDKMDLSMDVTVAMNIEQQNDLACMIEFLKKSGYKASSICANVFHDLYGLRAAHLGHPSGDCFCPRSSGYAQRHPIEQTS